MSENIIALNVDNIDGVLYRTDNTTMVYVSSNGCAPCGAVSIFYPTLSAMYADRVTFTKLNASEFPAIAADLTIRSTPTFLVFHRGEEVGRFQGFKTMNQLKDLLEVILNEHLK